MQIASVPRNLLRQSPSKIDMAPKTRIPTGLTQAPCTDASHGHSQNSAMKLVRLCRQSPQTPQGRSPNNSKQSCKTLQRSSSCSARQVASTHKKAPQTRKGSPEAPQTNTFNAAIDLMINSKTYLLHSKAIQQKQTKRKHKLKSRHNMMQQIKHNTSSRGNNRLEAKQKEYKSNATIKATT